MLNLKKKNNETFPFVSFHRNRVFLVFLFPVVLVFLWTLCSLWTCFSVEGKLSKRTITLIWCPALMKLSILISDNVIWYPAASHQFFCFLYCTSIGLQDYKFWEFRSIPLQMFFHTMLTTKVPDTPLYHIH